MSSPSYTEFSAGDSMLGYIYQCEYALYHLLDRDQAISQVSIETVDDVVSGGGGEGDPQTLLQLKLHGGGATGRIPSLTNRSTDLWKTLRVWSTLIAGKVIDPDVTAFVLATTAPLGLQDGIAHMLPPKGSTVERKPAKAHDQLREEALDISASELAENSALRKGATAFLELAPAQAAALVMNLVVQTSTPSIEDLRSKIERRLRASGSTDETHKQFVETVIGWWYSACIQHLKSKGENPITFAALERHLAEVAQSLAIGNLPRYPSAENPTPDELEALKERTFVRQITSVGLKPNNSLTVSAMLDFYKANAHRKRWLEEYRVNYDELGEFENDLRNSWNMYFGVAEVDCADHDASDNPEQGYQGVGRRVLQQTLAHKAAPLKGFDAEFIARGTYHMLANGDRPTVGWHPQWRTLFTQKEPSA